ncbi:hypothetical protein FAZ15_16155 [Sphingobacterium olei]|uniref:RHS repeat-associated core domain-containing protein n=1 Tax=Sphingobacterium olei TaxID=2571155 RepID=A0A4U0NIR2_9SPHI|nr:hypothetical protein [Sphingobacterium olei]TJZ53572.1 hypothetical protein FAZ15_16155 [Sphingobacterium olei]
MITKLRKFGQKKLAAFLLFVFISELIFPNMAWALTSGPTTPETTSFEPVDTTDMVNLQTGDFTYNIPLLEVPGPEGGYPLSLSYHAGILPGEDASWVGLGWSLNPGALTRNVNGYPDDWSSQKQVVRDYWEGGTTTTYNVGVSVGMAGPVANVGVGLEFSQDTYRGFGVGGSLNADLYKVGSATLGAKVGISPYGDSYEGLNIGVGIGTGSSGLNAGLSLGIALNSNGISAGMSGGVGYGINNSLGSDNLSLIGASIGTGGTKPSLSVGGLAASITNSNAGRIQTKNSGFAFGIPIWAGLNLQLGYNKSRYWSDETLSKSAYGSLNSWKIKNSDEESVFDSYSLLDYFSDQSIAYKEHPARTLGGGYLDFDQYHVNAQGLGGNIKPYYFQGQIRSQTFKNYLLNSVVYPNNVDNRGVQPYFRFVHDFSNKYRQNYHNLSFDNAPSYGNSDSNFGYGGGNKVAGSKHIVTYELDNVAIKPRNAKGYTTSWVKSFEGGNVPNRANLIGGFSITNESGVTYHFSLPAYSFKEETYQERIDKSSGLSFNRQVKTEPYAYTWHLTAITGSDFVDRNGNNIVDEGDWGYWVSFEYGRFTDKYVWRNPDTGFHRDEDNEFHGMSIGTKEVYYLNAIRTRSHIAVFEKEFRIDGKSVSSSSYTKYSNNGSNEGSFSHHSIHSMRLNKVYLFNAVDSLAIRSDDGGQNSPRFVANTCLACEFPHHVIDGNDVEAIGRNSVEDKALRIIEFDYNYLLSQGTPNSFDINSVEGKYGKLTLNGYRIRGKKGAHVLPATQFEYDYSNEEAPIENVNFISSSKFRYKYPVFQKGDMLVTEDGRYAGVVDSDPIPNDPGFTLFYTYNIRNSSVTFLGGQEVALRKTKNPPYSKDNKDNWGFFMSDHDKETTINNYNIGKQTTPISAKGVDAWSLRKIKTHLGNEIGIEYESDDYSKSVFAEDMSSIMLNPQKINDNTLEFRIDSRGYPLDDYIKVGHSYKAVINTEDLVYIPTVGNNVYDDYVIDLVLNITQIKTGGVIVANTNKPLNVQVFLSPHEISQNKFNIKTGNIVGKSTNAIQFGGGVRVERLTMRDLNGRRLVTKYDYNSISNDNGTVRSSGITSYKPSILPSFEKSKVKNTASRWFFTTNGIRITPLTTYMEILYKDFEKLYMLSRELPPPSVIYEDVKVSTEILDHNGNVIDRKGRTEFKFDVLRENMIGNQLLNNSQNGNQLDRNQVIRKFISAVGNLKQVRKYNENNKLIHETINHYLHDGLENETLSNFMLKYDYRLEQYHYQGVFHERVLENKYVYDKSTSNPSYKTYKIFNAKEELPCIQTGVTVKDYINNLTTKSKNVGFDFYSGSLTKQISEDGYGNRFLTENFPAYKQYPEMGLRINTSGNKNMLSQKAGTVIYKVNATDVKTAVVSASAQTWSKTVPVLQPEGGTIVQNTGTNGHVWRTTDSYSWLPTSSGTDGLTTISNFSAFNWTVPGSSHTNWIKTSGIKLYNVYSKALEGQDINGTYASTRLGYKNSKVTVTGSPAKYTELIFSGAEDETISGSNPLEVQRGNGTVSTVQAHTGLKSLLLSSGQSGFEYTVPVNNITPGRDYMAAVWVRPISGTASDTKLYYQVNGTPKGTSVSSSTSTKKAGDWILVTLNIKGSDIISGATLKVGVRNDHNTQVYADDFRFQPADALSMAYVYDNFSGELTYILDNNNLFIRYEYDSMGRLLSTYAEKMGEASPYKVFETTYNYGKPIQLVGTNNFTVFARVELQNQNTVNDFPNSREYHKVDAYIRTYWDASCMSQAILPEGISFKYQIEDYYEDRYGSTSSLSHHFAIIPQGASSIKIGDQIINFEIQGIFDAYGYDNIMKEKFFRLLNNHSYGSGNYVPQQTRLSY